MTMINANFMASSESACGAPDTRRSPATQDDAVISQSARRGGDRIIRDGVSLPNIDVFASDSGREGGGRLPQLIANQD
jgi:hypothetical protein